MVVDVSEYISDNILYEWDHSKLVEVKLGHPDDFLKIKETLTRMGVGNPQSTVLTQTCHILHRGGDYFICHFKELFRLEGRRADITLHDVGRRNAIVKLLVEWGLCTIVDPTKVGNSVPLNSICVIPHCEKHLWRLSSKHRLGRKK